MPYLVEVVRLKPVFLIYIAKEEADRSALLLRLPLGLPRISITPCGGLGPQSVRCGHSSRVQNKVQCREGASGQLTSGLAGDGAAGSGTACGTLTMGATAVERDAAAGSG